MLSFFIGMIVGIILGFIVMAIIAISGSCAREEEAYYKGFEDGKAEADKQLKK
jgi:uncharacterized membrane-anchored protein YhcB (DUF1043 family)